MRVGVAFGLGFVAGLVGVVRGLGQAGAADEGDLSDEAVAASVRAEWRRLGLLADRVDVTVLDGTAFLRGSADPVTADTLLATARRLPGVGAINDEVKRPEPKR